MEMRLLPRIPRILPPSPVGERRGGMLKDIHQLWYAPAIKTALDNCKALASPSDPAVKRRSDQEFASAGPSGETGWGIARVTRSGGRNRYGDLQEWWGNPKTGTRNAYGIDRRAQSYGVCMGGDTLLPQSIMLVTRNAGGDAKVKMEKLLIHERMGKSSWLPGRIGKFWAAEIECT